MLLLLSSSSFIIISCCLFFLCVVLLLMVCAIFWHLHQFRSIFFYPKLNLKKKNQQRHLLKRFIFFLPICYLINLLSVNVIVNCNLYYTNLVFFCCCCWLPVFLSYPFSIFRLNNNPIKKQINKWNISHLGNKKKTKTWINNINKIGLTKILLKRKRNKKKIGNIFWIFFC